MTNHKAKIRKSIAELSALSHLQIVASSDSLGWGGVRLEVGDNHGCNVEDVMVDGHYVNFNLSGTTLNFETHNNGGWVRRCQPPQTFWIVPEGRPFSIRHEEAYRWAGIIVDGPFLDDIMGSHYELEFDTKVIDPLLGHLMMALVSSMEDPHHRPPRLIEDLIRVFVYTLGAHHGHQAAELPLKGGIAPYQLNSLLRWLEDNVAEPITIDIMAARAGLSVAHFSREFKKSTGSTPWGYFVNLRLDRARALLSSGQSVGQVALACGFSDHSHLARHFKSRFGMAPLSFIKQHTPSETHIIK